MTPRSAPKLLKRLQDRHHKNISLARSLHELPDECLRQRPGPKSWCALEAVEHTNIWNRDYLARVEAALADHGTAARETFTSTRLGNFFVSSVKPSPKTRKIPTLKRLNPIHRDLDRKVLDEWLVNSGRLTAVLEEAEWANLNQVKVPTALTSLISLRLGDTLRMMVYHDWRHLRQGWKATD